MRKGLYASWVESKPWGIFITVVTLYALFGDDLRLLAFTKSADEAFYLLSFFALLIFTLEIIVSVYARKDYVWGFIFWLDIISTLSLVPDVNFLWNPIIANLDDSSGVSSNNNVLQASRATKAGTRATRMIRIVRLVRMVRMVKLFKHYTLWTKAKFGFHNRTSTYDLPHEHDSGSAGEREIGNEPTKIGKKLLASTSKRVISLVLIIILLLPAFEKSVLDWNQYQAYGLNNLHRMSQDYNFSGKLSDTDMKKAVWEYARNAGKLIYLETCTRNCPNTWSHSTTNTWLEELRFQPLKGNGEVDTAAPFSLKHNPLNGWSYDDMYSDVSHIERDFRYEESPNVVALGCFLPCVKLNVKDPWDGTVDEFCSADMDEYGSPYGVISPRYSGCISKAYFDNRAQTKLFAGLSMLKTVFVMFVLGVAIVLFHRDAYKNVVGPIERMTSIVKQLSKDPLAVPQLSRQRKDRMGVETEIIEQTLQKVGALMRVGFGAAGAEIIRQNLSSGVFDPIVRGKMITACYMFCDIRKFTDTTECLQEEVMVYVNKIGELVHGITVGYYGMANKNVGDAFLLSWKLQDGELPGFSTYSDGPDGIGRGILKNITCPAHAGAGGEKRELTPVELADSVLAATVKICNDLMIANVSGNLSVYRNVEGIRDRFGPNFRVNMGFGVHCGWCIEGAIGSRYKIDCTYLSPHVDMSDRLEASSKVFKTPICISHWLVGLLSPEAKKLLRIVDRITVPGLFKEQNSQELTNNAVKEHIPMTIYTFDVTDPVMKFLEPKFDPETVSSRKKQLPIKWGSDEVLKQVSEARRSVSRQFYKVYNRGVDMYLKGDWKNAKQLLTEAKNLYPPDGPCQQLLSYMASESYEPPENWLKEYHSMPKF